MVRNIRFESRDGFRPVWRTSDPLRLTRQYGIDFGLDIRWPIVVGQAVVVAY
jgi:hypothetical protein